MLGERVLGLFRALRDDPLDLIVDNSSVCCEAALVV
jgi:hypothetical protein